MILDRLASLALLLAIAAVPVAPAADGNPRPLVFHPNPVDAAAPQSKPWRPDVFQQKHEAILARLREGPVGVAFVGDSITERWKEAPAAWAEFAPFAPANLGVGGDSTQHVIWRLEHGELDGYRARVFVLMIGTNNTAGHTAPQIAAGIRRIIDLIQARQPQAKVLLLGIFPRGVRHQDDGLYDDAVMRMRTIRAVNATLATWDNGTTIRYLDLGDRFTGPDGQVREDLLPDHLHPGPAGCKVWADAMLPLLRAMYGPVDSRP